MTTNNVTRLLDSRKIPHTAFELPPEKLGAIVTAERLNVPPEMVFKTIVVTQKKPGKPALTVVNALQEVDLKLVAQVLKVKKVSLPTQAEAEKLTGLQAGGISPLALTNKTLPRPAGPKVRRPFDEIHISGGQRGLNIRLPVKDLVKLTKARVAKIGQ